MVAVGDRVKLISPMVNKNSAWMPVEEGMPAGLEGTVTHVNLTGPQEWQQIGVRWDNGRSLALLPGIDFFTVCD